MIKTREPSPEMAAASRPSGFRAKRRAWREEENQNTPTTVDEPSEEANKLATNQQQSGNKLATNIEQTSNKVETELATNQQQSGNKKEVRKETSNKVAAELATDSATKWQQTSNKLATNPTFLSLVGLQRAAMIFLYESCKAARSRSTEALTLEHVGLCLKTSSGSVRTTLQRLEHKEYIIRVSFKNGRGGWSKYELPEPLFRELLQLETENKLATKWQQTSNKVAAELATELATTPSSSSSSLLDGDKKLTTTEELQIADQTKHELPPEWESIDFSDLVALEVQFGRPHLKQWCERNYCTAEQAQESIYHFAFFLKHSKKGDIKTGPLNFFMGIMHKQKYFARPDSYLSPEEEGLRKRTEDMRKKSESLKALEQDLYDYSFDIWFRSLSEDEIQTLAPNIFQYEPRKSVLRKVFLDKYWSKVKSNPNLDPATLGKLEAQPYMADEREELSPEEIRRIADQQFGALRSQGGNT